MSGTGFLVRYEKNGKYYDFLIAAKHVINQANQLRLYLNRAALPGDYPDKTLIKEKIIILSSLTVQSRGIYDKLIDAKESAELLIGTKKKWDKTKRILVAGTKKGGVGLNDPSLTMLILASSTKDVRQFEGRIRTTDNLIYDVVDDNRTLEKHWDIREDWYDERGASIVYEGCTVGSSIKSAKQSKGALPLERFSGKK